MGLGCVWLTRHFNGEEGKIGVLLKAIKFHTHEINIFILWFKVAVSVIDSDDPETYRSWCIDRVSADTQNEMNKIFKNY